MATSGLHRCVKRRRRVQRTIRLAVPFPGPQRKQRATANRFRTRLVTGVAVEQAGLEVCDADICRFRPDRPLRYALNG